MAGFTCCGAVEGKPLLTPDPTYPVPSVPCIYYFVTSKFKAGEHVGSLFAQTTRKPASQMFQQMPNKEI